MPNFRAPMICTIATALVAALAFAGTASAQSDDNRGTIKVHDDETEDPEQQNVPHVSCDFWVQGFNMKDESGWLLFLSWPPTGDKSAVEPDGDDLYWNGTADGDGEYDFLKGPYQLPAGHYRVEVYTDDGHPGHDGHFAKAKMFWVDPCDDTEQPCVDDETTEEDECNPVVDCPEDVPAEDCETEIPFFPGFTSLALGSLGALAVVGMMWRRRS